MEKVLKQRSVLLEFVFLENLPVSVKTASLI